MEADLGFHLQFFELPHGVGTILHDCVKAVKELQDVKRILMVNVAYILYVVYQKKEKPSRRGSTAPSPGKENDSH